MRRLSSFLAAFAVAALILEVLPGSAATDIVLRRTSGSVGYRTTATAPLITVTGEQTVADNSYALTGPASLGVVVFPDSSLVRLGANTEVQIGAFKTAEQGNGSSIKVGSRGGTMRFQIRHPAGAKSNYNFDTSIMNIAVRGTTALLADGPEGDVLTCLQCTAGDVVVTVGGSKYALLTSQTMVVTPAGKVSVNATTDSELGEFRSSGLPTSLGPDDGSASAAAGPPQNGAIIGVAAAIIGGVAIAAAASHGGSVSGQSGTVPTPTPTPTASGFGPVVLTPSSISLSSQNKSATVTASQTGNTQNQFLASSPNIVCPSGGTASIAQGPSNTFQVTWTAAPVTQNCTATINGVGNMATVLPITLSP